MTWGSTPPTLDAHHHRRPAPIYTQTNFSKGYLTMGRLEKLKELEAKLYTEMQCAGPKEIASIARQYRETLREIEEIEGANNGENEIDSILGEIWESGTSV